MKNIEDKNLARTGKWVSLCTSVMVLISFSFAILTTPKSGPNCTSSCVSYPYTDIAKFFPFDYIWMTLMSIAILIYLLLFTVIHYNTSSSKKIFSQFAMNFAILTSLTLVLNYLVQILVIQASVKNNEYEGMVLLTQYNPHGIFIALEVIGYLFMAISFAFLVPAIEGKTKEEKWIRITLILSTVFSFIALFVFYGIYGINTGDRFEVAVILFTWSALIIIGFLFYSYFKKQEVGSL